MRSKRLTAHSALHPVSTEKILGNKHWLVSMILSSDGLVYGLCALMCGSVAALDGYAQFGNLEREAKYIPQNKSRSNRFLTRTQLYRLTIGYKRRLIQQSSRRGLTLNDMSDHSDTHQNLRHILYLNQRINDPRDSILLLRWMSSRCEWQSVDRSQTNFVSNPNTHSTRSVHTQETTYTLCNPSYDIICSAKSTLKTLFSMKFT